MRIYITFGQIHVHHLNGRTFDKDCVAVIDCENMEDGREKAFRLFRGRFALSYTEEQVNREDFMSFFPRGLMPVERRKHERRSRAHD